MRGPILAVLLLAAMAPVARGGWRAVMPGPGLQQALDAAAPGDTLELAEGVHAGPVTIAKPVLVAGQPGAVVRGTGHGTVITVTAPGTRLSGFTVGGSGGRVLTADAGIKLVSAAGCRLEEVRSIDNLYGIYLENSPGCEVLDCHIEGRRGPEDEGLSGNGVHLWFSPRCRIADTEVSGHLDGIYISFSRNVTVERDHLVRNIRYGLHYMNCQDNRIRATVFERNIAGCAIMFSNHLDVRGNRFIRNRGSRTYGLLLRSCSEGTFEGNRFEDNTIAVFMDDSNRNRFAGNLFAENGWGLFVFSSSAGNVFTANDFIQDDYPVALDMRRTDNRFDDGRTGNYWSDARPYDLDGDGRSDVGHSPVSAFAFLSKQYPDLALLAQSPAVVALSAAERVFPALQPSDAVDHRPMLAPCTRTGSTARSRTGRAPWFAAAGALVAAASAGALRGRLA